MSHKRFYESDPTVKQAVDVMLLFPAEIQEVIGQGFSQIAERDFKADELMNNYRSMGADKVLALYKSKKKQRAYDKNPAVHQAVNYLMLMTPENRRFLAIQVVELMGFMQEYLKACRQYQQPAQAQVAKGITETYVKKGPAEAQAFLKALVSEFQKRLSGEETLQAVSKGEKDSSLVEAISSETQGMKIKGDLV
jgi:hypothetical protein